jgi:hypothetical protein
MKDIPGVSINYWWFGQIVDESHWQDPTLGTLHKPSDLKGENYTYKVRIIGRHDPEKIIPDSQLFTASVLLPTTAGGGSAGSVQTPNIRQGAFVSGFYKDGNDGNEPIIAFVLPNNSQTELLLGDPNKGFIPRSGFSGLNGYKQVSTMDINISNSPTSINESGNPNLSSVGNKDQFIDGSRVFYIPKTKYCEGPSGPLKGIQKNLGNAIATLNLIKSGATGSVSDLNGLVQNQLNFYQEQIQILTKTLIGSIRTYIINKISNSYNDILEKLPPNLRVSYNDKFETASDLLLCIFQKIIRNLGGTIKDFFSQVIDKYISAPLCAAESFVANIISSIFNELSEGINSTIAGLGLGNITGTIFSAFSTVIGVLEFLTCEEELNCEMIEEWSIFGGIRGVVETTSVGIESRVAGITSSILAGQQPISCNTAQLPCGPPTISFIGNGFGASANPIISATGSIIGLDLINPGSGYSKPPLIQITDVCGNGNGATAIAIMKEDTIENIIMLDPGTGYLQYPDGSSGANGITISTPNDTIVVDNEENNSIYPCNTFVEVIKGNLIYLKNGAIVDIYSPEGEILQTIMGKGQTTAIKIEVNGTLTTPECSIRVEVPPVDSEYPVYVDLVDVALINPGSGYSPEDKIIITPSNGVETKTIFDENGSVKDITITNNGTGFNDIPTITIQSNTGFNANIIPVFKIIRIDELKNKGFEIPTGAPIINVVDCVGKVKK